MAGSLIQSKRSTSPEGIAHKPCADENRATRLDEVRKTLTWFREHPAPNDAWQQLATLILEEWTMPGRTHHDAGCPRLQVWDGGEDIPCTCDDEEDEDSAYLEVLEQRDNALRRVSFLRRMMESALMELRARYPDAESLGERLIAQALKSDAEDAK